MKSCGVIKMSEKKEVVVTFKCSQSFLTRIDWLAEDPDFGDRSKLIRASLLFVGHIQRHLIEMGSGGSVMCKICDRTIGEIVMDDE